MHFLSGSLLYGKKGPSKNREDGKIRVPEGKIFPDSALFFCVLHISVKKIMVFPHYNQPACPYL
jgi:hypothetical protein